MSYSRNALLARLILAPFMIHELLLSPTETASGSHPCCVVSVTYHRPSYFHGGNPGSNPVGDANLINHLRNCRFWRGRYRHGSTQARGIELRNPAVRLAGLAVPVTQSSAYLRSGWRDSSRHCLRQTLFPPWSAALASAEEWEGLLCLARAPLSRI